MSSSSSLLTARITTSIAGESRSTPLLLETHQFVVGRSSITSRRYQRANMTMFRMVLQLSLALLSILTRHPIHTTAWIASPTTTWQVPYNYNYCSHSKHLRPRGGIDRCFVTATRSHASVVAAAATTSTTGSSSGGDNDQEGGNTAVPSIKSSTRTTSSAVVDRFHQDMKRVLESRLDKLEPLLKTSHERKNRPVVLDADIDGAERVYAMLQHLVSIDAATEESFQIALQAFVRRDRMRWYRQVKPVALQRQRRRPSDDEDEEHQLVPERSSSSSSSTNNKHNANNNKMELVCAADVAEEILQQLLQTTMTTAAATPVIADSATGTTSVSMETYNLVLEAYGNCATPRGDRQHYATKAQKLLDRLMNVFGVDAVPIESFMHVLHTYAWSQPNLQDGVYADKAQRLLGLIEERIGIDTTDTHTEMYRNIRTADAAILMQCYDWVLEAWSKSGSVGSADKADLLLGKMKDLNSTLVFDSSSVDVDDIDGDDDDGESIVIRETKALLDAQTYSNAILAWSKASENGATERCHELLEEMLRKFKNGEFPPGSEPTLIAFNGAITAWGRKGRPDKAEELLSALQAVRPKCKNLVPDVVTYNSVLHAHLRSSDKVLALERILALVRYMEDNYILQPAIKPNSFTYGSLLKCWIQSGNPNLAEEAERTLIQMERLWWEENDDAVAPNNRIFNMVINAYAKSSHRFAAQKALDLLRRMKSASSKECHPDTISYTSVLECLSKSYDPTAPEKAIELLEELSDLYAETGDPAQMPNLRTFTMAIQTLAMNNGSVRKARELLTQLVSLYKETNDPQLRPNEYPYNYVLNCAANSLQDDQGEAFRIATDTYQEMRKSDLVRPDSFTYAFWLKCCNNLLPAGDLRNKCVKYAFEECKRNGLVTHELLTRLFQGSPAALVDEVLELDEKTNYRALQVDQLPASWSANVKTKNNRRRKQWTQEPRPRKK